MARGAAPIHQLDDIRSPITDVLQAFQQQLAELQRYKARFGPLDDDGGGGGAFEEIEDGSDTEQE